MQNAKDKLINQLETNFKTVFIGNLSDIEEEFGFLWGHGKPFNSLTKDEREYRLIWNDLRKRILDRGNNEIAKVLKHIELYDINSKRFKIVLPIKEAP